jgi:flavin-binding protein dodecin
VANQQDWSALRRRDLFDPAEEELAPELHSLEPIKEESMAVVKIIELVGSSKTSTDDAAKQALTEAQSSLRNIRAVDIVSTGIRGENLDEYRAHVRVAFIVDQADVD